MISRAIPSYVGGLGHGLKAVHRFVHFADHHVSPTAVIKIDLAVVVLKKVGIDGLGAVVNGVDQRSAIGKYVFEGALGVVTNADIQAADLLLAVDIVGGKNDVVLPCLFHHGGRPDGALCAVIGRHIQNVAVDLKMLQILGGDQIQIFLLVKGQRVGHVNIDRVAVHAGFGIGIPVACNRIFHSSSPCKINR